MKDRNHIEAFESAIDQGLNPDGYMYMYSTKLRDYFKNKITKEYVSFPQIRQSYVRVRLGVYGDIDPRNNGK